MLARFVNSLNSDIKDYQLDALLGRFTLAPAESLEKVLIDYLKTLTSEHSLFFVVLQFLIHRHVQAAETIALLHLDTLASDESSRQKMSRIISILSKYSVSNTWWATFWSLLQQDSANQKEFLDVVIDWHYSPYLRYLNEKELYNLYELAVKLYPYSEDREFHGGGVPDWHIKQEWRDSILKEIAGRGTKISIDLLTPLTDAHIKPPNIFYLLNQVWERYRMESWTPPQPLTILQLAADSQKHYPRSAKQLRDLIVSQLKQIEDEFKISQIRRYALWHPQADGTFRPVDREERFANAIAEWLRERLPRVIINREPQVHHGIYSTQGNNTDIIVETFNDTNEQLVVIIEAKCCWYQAIYQKMQTQLVDQYLSNHLICKDGLYLVGYFASDRWSPSDIDRAQLCSRRTKEQLLEGLREAKERLVLPTSLSVEIFIFDASI